MQNETNVIDRVLWVSNCLSLITIFSSVAAYIFIMNDVEQLNLEYAIHAKEFMDMCETTSLELDDIEAPRVRRQFYPTPIERNEDIYPTLSRKPEGLTKYAQEPEVCDCTRKRCPRGPRGPPGNDGIAAEDGQPGTPGTPGLDGIHQLDVQCEPCPPPPKGEPGPPGERGPRGRPGRPGSDAQDGTNEPGLPGETGPRGPPGQRGKNGIPGLPGQDSVQLVGTPGLRGPNGPVGFPGARGDPGKSGEPAPPGKEGPRGPPGEPGDLGDFGARGRKGPQGPPGDPAGYCQCPARQAGEYPANPTISPATNLSPLPPIPSIPARPSPIVPEYTRERATLSPFTPFPATLPSISTERAIDEIERQREEFSAPPLPYLNGPVGRTIEQDPDLFVHNQYKPDFKPHYVNPSARTRNPFISYRESHEDPDMIEVRTRKRASTTRSPSSRVSFDFRK